MTQYKYDQRAFTIWNCKPRLTSMSISPKTPPRLDSRVIRMFTLEGKYDWH